MMEAVNPMAAMPVVDMAGIVTDFAIALMAMPFLGRDRQRGANRGEPDKGSESDVSFGHRAHDTNLRASCARSGIGSAGGPSGPPGFFVSGAARPHMVAAAMRCHQFVRGLLLVVGQRGVERAPRGLQPARGAGHRLSALLPLIEAVE
jgi:hypothetical protein